MHGLETLVLLKVIMRLQFANLRQSMQETGADRIIFAPYTGRLRSIQQQAELYFCASFLVCIPEITYNL